MWGEVFWLVFKVFFILLFSCIKYKDKFNRKYIRFLRRNIGDCRGRFECGDMGF